MNDVDEQVTAIRAALAGKVDRLRAAHLRYVWLSMQLSTPGGRMHCSAVAAGLEMAIELVEDMLTAVPAEPF